MKKRINKAVIVGEVALVLAAVTALIVGMVQAFQRGEAALGGIALAGLVLLGLLLGALAVEGMTR